MRSGKIAHSGAVKANLSLDGVTVAQIDYLGVQKGWNKSQVVREAVARMHAEESKKDGRANGSARVRPA